MSKLKLKNININLWLLAFTIILGGFFRFYKLDWGEQLFTHPDEYHIVASVLQLSFPTQMHPHFFSYGTVTIYLIYFTKMFLENVLFQLPFFNTNFFIADSFLIGRFYSALFSTLTIFLVYKITSFFLKKPWSIIAAFLVAIIPGSIQQAHFATPESNLTFFLFASFLFLLNYVSKNKTSFVIFASICFGLALGVKISTLVFAPVLFSVIFLKNWPLLIRSARLVLLSIFITFITLFIAAPFIFLDFKAFQNNLNYEGELALGNINVFYTRQFINTSPVLFQLEKILPYALGPTLLVFGIMGFLFLILLFLKNPKVNLFLVFLAFSLLFFSNAFLFAKWTRFIAHTFPFFAIFSVFLLSFIYKKTRSLGIFLTFIFVVFNFFWLLTFFSIYTRHDIRVTASKWLVKNTPPGSTFLVEGGNMVDIPLEGDYQRISLFFFNIENNQEVKQQIRNGLEKSDYFLVQSRRVFLNHQRLPKQFPKTARFYDELFSGRLGFTKIKEFTAYPSLQFGKFKFEIPDETAEETWSVFDHPVIRVFKKEKLIPYLYN